MKIHDLSPVEGSTKSRMRVGRGIGSGKGKTCGRGQKGQKAREGVSINGFEGGQMPIHRRMPKMGFNNIFRKKFSELTLEKLQYAIDLKYIDGKKAIDEDALIEAKVVRRKNDGIRLIGSSEIKSKVDIIVSGASAGAKKAIEAAGGSVSIIEKKVAPVKRPIRD